MPSIGCSGQFGAQENARPSGLWETFYGAPRVMNGISAMNASTHVHRFTPWYDQMRSALVSWWMAGLILWRWGKPQCRYPAPVVARTPCVAGADTQCRWKTCLTSIGGVYSTGFTTIHHRRKEQTPSNRYCCLPCSFQFLDQLDLLDCNDLAMRMPCQLSVLYVSRLHASGSCLAFISWDIVWGLALLY